MRTYFRFFLLFLFLANTQFARSQDPLNELTQAIRYCNNEQYSDAVPLFEKWIPIVKEAYGKDDTTVYLLLNKLAGNAYYSLAMYDKAEPIMKEVIRILQDQFGEGHHDYSAALNNLAEVYQATGRYGMAEQLMKDALRVADVKFGKNGREYSISLNNLAALYHIIGRYDQSETMMKNVLMIEKQTVGDDHPSYATSLNNLAQLYTDMGRYEEAEPLQKRAIQIDGKKLGEDHPDYARDLSGLGAIYQDVARYDLAEPLMKDAIRIYKNRWGEAHPDYATALNNLATLYQDMGRFEQSEQLMVDALTIQKVLGEDHPSYAISLNNLATLYLDMGRYKEAEPLMKKVLEIARRKGGDRFPGFAIDLNNLGQLYHDMGSYEEAEPLMKEALQADKINLHEKHPSYARDLNNLAQLYVDMHRFEKAEPLQKEALQIDKENFGENHPSYARELNNLAELYQRMGRYKEAEPLIKQALRIDKEKFGNDYAANTEPLSNLANLYMSIGHDEQAQPLMKEVFRIFQYQLTNNTGFLSEKEREEFLRKFMFYLEIYQSFNFSTSVKDSLSQSGAFGVDIELNRKGILLREAQQFKSRILESGNPSLVNTLNRILFLKKQIEKLNSLDSAKRYDDPAKLEQEATKLEKTLAFQSKDYRQSKEDASLTWKEIQQHLKTGEAVVEFSSFRFYDKRWTDSIYYCALVLRPGYTAPKMVFQFEERALSKLLNNKSPALKQMLTQVYSPNRDLEDIPSGDIFYPSASLYNLIMNPIENLLYGAKTIYYVPSGLLNRVSFPAIAININERLADKYNLIYLSTSKKLVTQQQEKGILNENTHVALFGGINYEWNSNQQQRFQQTAGSDFVASEAGFVPFEQQRNETFDSLPGSRAEVRAIDELCHLHKIKDDLYTDDLATEAQFKSLSGNNAPSIIHVATHGFFIPDTDGKSGKDLYTNSRIPGYIYAKDPLLRSGLALAGVRRAWFGGVIPEGMENGILQAKEVSNMDLRNTKLVVLSACETGLGDVKGSEGVFGLQRSFKMAGADYLLMSLWKVPDEATQKLMTMFYENLFSGQPIREAFKNAQTRLRHLNSDYENPYYWGAWVLME